MDIQDVFIIIGEGWTKEKIIEDLRGEGYKHNFYFDNDKSDMEVLMDKVKFANEVWTFGDCMSCGMYAYAMLLGKECWKMG